jgi:hypothetical protein
MIARLGCLWIFLAVVGALAAFNILWTKLSPITQESYERCVAEVAAARRENIAICVKQYLAEDLEKSRTELPVLPSRSEREADCRFIWGKTPEDRCRRPP